MRKPGFTGNSLGHHEMTPDRWERIKELFESALELSPDERVRLLAGACSGDEPVRLEVERLLAEYDRAGSFMETFTEHLDPDAASGPNEGGTAVTRDMDPAEVAGTIIGPYHLLQRIGEGGMGEVWLAEQKEPVCRRVALKLIKAGMDSREVIARFESERQALALMDHPAIAKVFDAGSTPEGRPYFAMEYVAGFPITDYCDMHKLNTRERLELFMLVCDGVQHAHQKAILHRDLKPSNILVSEVGGKPAPRIIDFGVAKATAQRLTAGTVFTQAGIIVGTPGHMSPEQANSVGVDVDTRTDVYSLGVVLYQLLVGVVPLDFSKTPLDQFPRKLREEESPRPSAKLRTMGEQSGTVAQNRGSDLSTLARQLRGDMDAIALKALEKERSRRYATPFELAADIGRHLRHEPVLARPASARYRARKYIRRHRIGVAVAGGLVAVLISFGVAQTLQLRRTTRERDRANRISTFMAGMFKVSDPSAARGNSITAREILDKASKEIETGLAKDPQLQAQMMETMGEVYDNLGLYNQARSLLTRAVDIRRRVLGPQNPDTLTSVHNLAVVLDGEGRYAEAEKLERETLDIRRRVLGPDHPDTLRSMNNLANVLHYGRHFAEAQKLYSDTLEIRRRVLGPDDPDTLASMNNLAKALRDHGHLAESDKLIRETLEIRRRVLGSDHPETLTSTNILAIILHDEGHYAEAEKLLGETLQIQRRVLGPDHPETLRSINNLAVALRDDGRYAESDKLDREALEIQRRVLGPEHPDALGSMRNLASDLHLEGHPAEAEKLVRETLAIERRVLGPNDPNTLGSTYNLGCIALAKGKRDEALSLLREAVEHGLAPYIDLENDPDLKSLHGDPRFAALVAHAKERAAAAPKAK